MPRTQTLFDRVGGDAAIGRFVDDFYDRVLADPELRPFFERSPMDKLRLMQREFFRAALGGPVEYTGTPLAHAHHGRGIEREHFGRFVEHLLATLQGHGIEESDTDEIIGRINTYANEIIGGHGLDG